MYNSTNNNVQSGTINNGDLQAAESGHDLFQDPGQQFDPRRRAAGAWPGCVTVAQEPQRHGFGICYHRYPAARGRHNLDGPGLCLPGRRAFAKVAPTEIVRITKAGGVEIVDQPEIPTDKASPRTVFDTAIGVIIGVMVAAVIVILRTLADTTIYLPEDIENMVGITVLGQIPDINSADDNYAYWTVTEEGAAKNEKE